MITYSEGHMKKEHTVYYQVLVLLLWVGVAYLGKWGFISYEPGMRNQTVLKFTITDFIIYTAIFFINIKMYHYFISAAVYWNKHFNMLLFSIIILVPFIYLGKHTYMQLAYEGILNIINVYMIDTVLCTIFHKRYEKSLA